MVEILLNRYPTHLPYTNNKKAPNKYVKLNYQNVYNGKISRFSRNVLMENIHKYICKRIPQDLNIEEFPIKVSLDLYTVINYGDVRRNKNGNISWKPPKENYEPSWDLDNAATIWIKAGLDALKKNNVFPDDNIKYVNSIEYNFYPIKEFKERKIIMRIK